MNARRILFLLAGLAMLGVAGFAAWKLAGTPGAPAATAAQKTYVNDKMLIAGGWSADEVSRIIDDFKKLYGLQLPKDFQYLVKSPAAGVVHVTFPRDMTPWMFFFLVNYATYPKAPDPAGRTVLVAGTTTLSPEFELPSQAMYGKHATIYVPAGDKDYDNVYLHIDGGETYKIPLQEGPWTAESDPRMPPNLPMLTGNN